MRALSLSKRFFQPAFDKLRLPGIRALSLSKRQ